MLKQRGAGLVTGFVTAPWKMVRGARTGDDQKEGGRGPQKKKHLEHPSPFCCLMMQTWFIGLARSSALLSPRMSSSSSSSTRRIEGFFICDQLTGSRVEGKPSAGVGKKNFWMSRGGIPPEASQRSLMDRQDAWFGSQGSTDQVIRIKTLEIWLIFLSAHGKENISYHIKTLLRFIYV